VDSVYYLNQFKNAAAKLDQSLITEKGIEVTVGIWLNSIVLRLIKPKWANNPHARPQTGSAIFFSVWINEGALEGHQISYNIHALKLRKLKGYKLTSRKFATAFREKFKPFEKAWPNVSVDFGPLTLMQGWKDTTPTQIEQQVFELALEFLKIDFLIDDLLEKSNISFIR
jgi:hypothetical protein